jgi:amino acid transporter
MIISGVLLVGLIKVVVGYFRDRPIGFLIAMIVGIMVVAAWAMGIARLTRAGKRKLAELQQQHDALRSPREETTTLSGETVAMTAALFGAAALIHYDGLSELGNELNNLRDRVGWTGSDGSGCGSDGGDGGGCGGGGCGGCGGCGG